MAGYSATPLAQKLGLKPDTRSIVLHCPFDYADLVHWPAAAFAVTLDGEFDFIHVFLTAFDQLDHTFHQLKPHLKKSGMLWISWPKKTSGIPSDLDENRIRESGLGAGLVDVKVAAVTDQWSALKFVYRVADRK